MGLAEAVAEFRTRMKAEKTFTPSGLFAALEPAFEAGGFRDSRRAVQNILVIRLDAIGDMVVTSGFFRELRRNFPLAGIDVVASPLVASLMEACPHVDEVFSFAEALFTKDFSGCFDAMTELCQQSLWPRRYELCLCPQWGDDKSATFLLAYMSGAENRVGFDQAIEWMYHPEAQVPEAAEVFQEDLEMIVCRTPPEIVHEAARSVFLLKNLGLRVEDDSLEAWIGEKERARARRWLAPYEGKCPVSLGIGAGIQNRKYPVEKYLIALDEIRKRHSNVVFVILGGAAEHADGQYLAQSLPAGQILDLTRRTTLRESAAVLAETSLYLGNNTGLMHLAAATGRPVIMTCQEPVDWKPACPGLDSLVARFSPWKVPSVVLRPAHAAGACAQSTLYGCCRANVPHCIAQIEPAAIVQAFDAMMEALGKA